MPRSLLKIVPSGKNSGIDVAGITRAALDNVSHGHVVSGGSTITQQLIKMRLLVNKESVMRKLQEITLAPSVTQQYTKQEVLNMYLNTAYYGEQAYGVEAAAFTYFDLPENVQGSSSLEIGYSSVCDAGWYCKCALRTRSLPAS